ncbi:hypothetical protein KC660_01675 [Candidatus Dojkabacteria bacterium]|uniref:Uncharacterized protein n=1 Tax=Candidatus Dojkabacteria bacterium TaxID=2099670 RepID=A0A955L3A8_9BACT|nr:hypothetical protein [Candidatus Dojkabacteria bacterium]
MNVFTEQTGKYKKGYKILVKLNLQDKVIPKVDEKIYFDDTIVVKENYSDSYDINLSDFIDSFDLQKVQKILKVIDGEFVESDSIIASYSSGFGGVIMKDITCPKAGIVDLSDLKNGIVKIASVSKTKKEIKGINGVVKKIVPGKYIEIMADVISIDAVIRFNPKDGLFNLNFISNLNEINEEKIKELSSINNIGIVYDGNFEVEELKRIAILGVKSVIATGIDPDKLYQDLNFFKKYDIELIILEGFGLSEMNPKLVSIFKKNEGMLYQTNNEGIHIVFKGSATPKVVKGFSGLRRGDLIRIYNDKNWGEYGKYYSKDSSSEDYARIKLAKKDHTISVQINNLVKII